jgi:hypothetical protein
VTFAINNIIEGIVMNKKLILAFFVFIGFLVIVLMQKALNNAEAEPLIIKTRMKYIPLVCNFIPLLTSLIRLKPFP